MEIKLHPDVEKFIKSLNEPAYAKVLRTIELLEKFGHQLGMPHSKKVRDSIFELRIRGQQEVRIFYCFHNRAAYLLHAFVKHSQKTPSRELDNAGAKYSALTGL